jgi:TRAP-type C4-dicarboxylate transport system permease small subunit
VDPVKPQVKRGVLFFVGSAGLIAVMVIEVIAVIGRHVRVPLLGALEMAQAAIVPAACASMVIASLTGAHAAVHLVTERMPEHVRGVMARASAVLAGVFFTSLAIGSCWLTFEFWSSFEETDVLHIPFRPLRVLVTICAAALALNFFHRGIRPAVRQ